MDKKVYNIIYAKNGGRPYNIEIENKKEVINFFLQNLNDIDLLIINGVIIDRTKLIKENLLLMRYLKIKKIYEI